MKKTIHFFGDSFTFGHTLNHTNHIWPKIIHKSLKGYEYKNYAIPGASPLFIIKQIIDNISNIKKNDIVFLLETIPNRIEVYSKKDNKIVPVTNSEIVEIYENKRFDKLYSLNEIKSVIDFMMYVRDDNLNEFSKFYNSINKNFLNYIDTICEKTIQIPWNITFDNIKDRRFETFEMILKNEKNNGHLTIKGNYQLSEYINKKYFNNELNLEKNYYI